METTRKLTAALLIGITAALAAWGSGAAGGLDAFEHIAWDFRQKFFARPAGPNVPIRVILLDEQSLEWGRVMGLTWPWPYEVYTPIIAFCRQSGAKAVAFDVQFTEPGRYGPADDKKLADMIAGAPDTVLPVQPGEQAGSVTAWPEHLARSGLNIGGLERYIASSGAQSLTAPRCVFPFDGLAHGAAMFGHITPDTFNPGDDDQTVRYMRPVIRFDNTDVPALGLAAYLVGTKQTTSEAWIEDNNLRIGDATIPMGANGRAWLLYRAPNAKENKHLYRSYSAAAVIQSQLRIVAGDKPTVDPAEFKDCYVFFGFSASGLHDNIPTPVMPLSPGVEVHATFLDNLLNQDFLYDARGTIVLPVTLVVSVLAALGILVVNGWQRHLAVFAIALPVPMLVGAVMLRSGTAWPVAWPMLAAGAALIGATVFSLATEGRQKRFIRRAFGHYLSPAVIERVLADPSLLQLGGERREVTVMFIDLEGFTSTAEKLDAQALSELLNHYLTAMSEAILEEDGTLDKYQGDAVMAFWNAPLDQPDHAIRACRAALRCKERLVGLRREWFERTGKEPRIRIGIHTGTCVVGNLGSKQRFDYTVLGDTANLASRIEGVNKAFGTTVLASEQTWSKVGGELAGRGIARVTVAGRSEPVIVIEPYSLNPREPHTTGDKFDHALMLCEEGKYVEAMHLFQQLGQDPAARAYADRLASMMESPSPAWDGVWDLSHKK